MHGRANLGAAEVNRNVRKHGGYSAKSKAALAYLKEIARLVRLQGPDGFSGSIAYRLSSFPTTFVTSDGRAYRRGMTGVDTSMPRMNTPEFKSIPEQAFESLIDTIRTIQNGLDDEHEIGVIANGAGFVLHVDAVSVDGQIAVFRGEDQDGRDSWLVQHYTQLNVLIVAVPKTKSEARRIGF